MSLTCIWITLLLVLLLLGIGAISCPMAKLVAVPAWHVARWNAGAYLSLLPFGRARKKAL